MDVYKKIKRLGNKKKNDTNSVYSMVSCSDLTPGSLDVWIDLPDEIKYDPSLAPFKQLYEQHRGKLETKDAIEGDKHTFDTNIENIHLTIENKGDSEPKIKVINGGNGTIDHLDSGDKNESMKKKQIKRAVRIMKLTGLVGCWIFLTVSLLISTEKVDTLFHTSIQSGELKEFKLNPSKDLVRLQVTLNGPFCEHHGNDTSSDLLIWINTYNGRLNPVHDENSGYWLVGVKSDAEFLTSTTISKKIELGNSDIYLGNASEYGNVTLRLRTNRTQNIAFTLSYQLNPLDERDGVLYATALLCILYALIIFEVVNRTIAALLSSSLAIAVLALNGERPSLPELVSWLDVETLLLLFSMMILVAILAETGLFDYLAVVAFEVTGGKTWPLINCLCLFTALFSTFLDNVTTVLLMTPVTIRLCEVMELNPVPILMAMVIFSNVGGSATPVGDPPNVIIASHPSVLKENINFATFTLHMGLGILLVCIQTYLQLRFMFRDMNKLRHNIPREIQEMRQEIFVWKRAAASLSSYSRDEDIVRIALQKKVERLHAALKKKEAGGKKTDPKFVTTLTEMKQKYQIRDKQLLIKSLISVIFVVVVFFLHAIPELQRLSLGWTALLGALLLLLLAERDDLEPILARVEWSTLLFFAALFVLMEALSKLGLISWIGNVTKSIILMAGEESRLLVGILLVLWVSGLASAFVDNIPLTTMMVRVMAALADPKGLDLPLAPLAWALSFGACLGGNGTLIGASANVVCAGVAEQHGYRFTFLQYFKVGFPIMLGNLIVASVYLLFSHCVFNWH